MEYSNVVILTPTSKQTFSILTSEAVEFEKHIKLNGFELLDSNINEYVHQIKYAKLNVKVQYVIEHKRPLMDSKGLLMIAALDGTLPMDYVNNLYPST